MRAMQAQMRELQRQVNEAKADAASRKRQPRRRPRPQGQVEGRAGAFQHRRQVQVQGPRPHHDRLQRHRSGQVRSPASRTSTPSSCAGLVSASKAWSATTGSTSSRWTSPATKSSVKDAYVAYANWAPLGEVGNPARSIQYVSNSLEEMTSSRFITFMERAAFIEAFFLDRQIGAGIYAGDDHWSFQTGYYGAAR